MDPLTDIFKTMHVRAVVPLRLEATAPWGITHSPEEADTRSAQSPDFKMFHPSEFAHVAMVSRGNCWLSVDGIPDPIPLTGGDCFLLAPGNGYALRDHPNTSTRSFCEVRRSAGGVLLYGGGGAPTTVIWSLLRFDKPSLKPVTQLLPRLILVKAEQARTLALQSTLQLLAAEMAEQSPGSEVVADRLAEVLFIQTLRAHIASSSEKCRQPWLRAIFDSQIGTALKAVHENVNGPWTVESLAETAGMSRSAFALRFKELLGQTPLDYVTDWRMQKALLLLKEKDKKLVEVAQSVGYESDAAFSKAFKRIVGLTPGEYRQAGMQ
jgi:AraC-like DNA-binding protein